MFKFGAGNLPAYAYQILDPVWIERAPATGDDLSSPVWRGIAFPDVQLAARRDGFIIFDFSASKRYSGGKIAPYSLAGNRIPAVAQKAEAERRALVYDCLSFVNSHQPAWLIMHEPSYGGRRS